MRKILLSIFILTLVFIIACQQAAKKEAGTAATSTPKVETPGDAAVDSVGNDLNNVDSVEKDLNADDLSNLDSGLNDTQSI